MSKPKELYRFTEGALLSWTVTSADTAEEYNGENYAPMALGRNSVEQKNELSKANLEVTTSIDNELARRWMRTSTDAVVGLTVFNKDTETGSAVVTWKGRLTAVKPDQKSIKLVFESVFTSLRRAGLRQRYQRTCPHVLYGAGCNLSRENFATSGQVASVNGTAIVFPAAASAPIGWYNAGIIEAEDGTARFITSHSGQNLTLIRPLEALSVAFANRGANNFSARIFPGCDRTTTTCANKFNNIVNNGSFPFIPLRTPFDGSSIV